MLRDREANPYSQLAHIYDYVMRHVNYEEWALYLQKIFSNADIRIEKILDISCGTANLPLKLSELGFSCMGFDASPDMVSAAKRKIEKSKHQIPVWVGDMRMFSTQIQFDAINCNYDSINYCSHPNELQKLCNSVAKTLCLGGFFIFDVSTIKNSKKYFQDYYEEEKTDGFEYTRQSYFLRDKRKQINEFRIKSGEHPGINFFEKHEQRIYAIQEIHDIVSSELFELIGIYDGFTLNPGSENSDRVHFVLKKVR